MLNSAPNPRLRIVGNAQLFFKAFFGLFRKNYSSRAAVDTLETKISGFVGAKHTVVTPTARAALYLTMKHCMPKDRREVLLSPYTITEVVNMVIASGCVPVFTDVDESTCNISPEEIKKNITKNTGAVLVTHFYGLMSNMDEIAKFCLEKNLILIEDAAQAFAAESGGIKAGRYGNFGVYSFGLYKFINAFYGGALVTDDDEVAFKIRQELEQWPLISKIQLLSKIIFGMIIGLVTYPPIFKTIFFRFFRFCFLRNIDIVNNQLKIDVAPKLKRQIPDEYKVQMSGLQASLILDQLNDKLEKQIYTRMRNASLYFEGLSNLAKITLPPLRDDKSHVYWYFPIMVEGRHSLVTFALKSGRDITKSYHRNCASLDCFREWGAVCVNAQKVADSVIYLPTYESYGEKEIQKTVDVIQNYFGER